jgi:hypothetical protein
MNIGNGILQNDEVDELETIGNIENIDEIFREFVTNVMVQESLTRMINEITYLKKKLLDDTHKETILDFMNEKIDMVKLEREERTCSLCEENGKMVDTRCCSFRQCKKCFLQWIYGKEVFTCPQCRCDSHESIDDRIFLFMKK